jgi:hypothetical protein
VRIDRPIASGKSGLSPVPRTTPAAIIAAGPFKRLPRKFILTSAVWALRLPADTTIRCALAGYRRVEEAAQFMDIQQIVLSLQCGFSGTLHGNDIQIE